MTADILTAAGRRLARLLLATLALLLATPVLAQAQGEGRGRTLRIALLDDAPVNAPLAQLVRAADPREPDLLVIAADQATPHLLRASLAFAKVAVRSIPRPPERGTSVASMASWTREPRKGAAEERAQQRAELLLARLRAQPEVAIGSLGRGRWVEVDLSEALGEARR